MSFCPVIGLCCETDYNLEIEVKIMTFELCFMRCGNFSGRERECDLGMERNGKETQQYWECELLDGNGRERESKTHSRTPLVACRRLINNVLYVIGQRASVVLASLSLSRLSGLNKRTVGAFELITSCFCGGTNLARSIRCVSRQYCYATNSRLMTVQEGRNEL